MKDIAILMACWKSPELLKVVIPSLLKAMRTNSEIIIILNEPDDESIKYLKEQKISYYENPRNDGPSAVDYAIPYIKEIGFKYVANVNSDMIFSDGWDIELINLYEKNKPCTVSCCLVEPVNNGHSIYEYLNFFDTNIHEIFNQNLKNGKYKTEESISYNHPILCGTEDFIAVGGYSDNMEQVWVDLKGRGLDNDFVYRLYKLHNGNIKYIKSDKSFVYHGVSLNSNKLKVRSPGHDAFKNKNKITTSDFNKMINYV